MLNLKKKEEEFKYVKFKSLTLCNAYFVLWGFIFLRLIEAGMMMMQIGGDEMIKKSCMNGTLYTFFKKYIFPIFQSFLLNNISCIIFYFFCCINIRCDLYLFQCLKYHVTEAKKKHKIKN